MLKRKYYSFERNNYFYGKLLTSRDFKNEQEYLNGKRRFINRTLHGVGIVCGLGVLMADDASLVLQSGFALDAGGREIVVPKTQVVKLATIDGYQELQTSTAYLGIEYKEEYAEPVYSVMDSDKGDDESRQFNIMTEGYRLYLLDEEMCTPAQSKASGYINKTIIYKDSDVCITQCTPAYVTEGNFAKVRIIVEKLSHKPFILSAKFEIVADGFVNKNLPVKIHNLCQDYGEKTSMEYDLIPEDYIFNGNELTLTMRGIEVQIAEKVNKIKKELTVPMKAIKENLLDCILENSYKGIMDVELDEGYDEKLWIAKVNILKSGSTVLIDSVSPAPFSQYVYQAKQLMSINEVKEFVPNAANAQNEDQLPEIAPSDGDTAGKARELTSGVFEMSLGNNGEAGKVYFSDEIMHGLGNGSIYVDIGIEYLNKNAEGMIESEEVILGDSSIFSNGEEEDNSVGQEKRYLVDTAVKLLPDRGTFVVGVRPRVKTGRMGIRIRWYAFKPEDLQQRVVDKAQSGCIMVKPDTIIISPKGTTHINPVFVNMPEEALTFTLLDSEGGKVENNGMYTAPSQEGVYEIRIACISNPDIYTQAFVIVTQKQDQ